MNRGIAVTLLILSVGLASMALLRRRNQRPAPPVEPPVDVMATVKPDGGFRVFRRRPADNAWDDGNPFDQAQALAVLNAMNGATRWDGDSHAAAYGQYHAHEPGITISLAWCKDIREKSQRDTQSVHICYGNWLFWYGDRIYQLTEQGHGVLNGAFPQNE